MSDLYKILNVSRTATQNEIKTSFRKLALSYHPDVTGNDRVKSEKFNNIKVAYETLVDEIARCKYDRDIGNRRVHMKTRTSYTGPTTTTSTHTYSEAGKTYTYRYTVTRSNTASNKGKPHGYNMDEWNAWHYGDKAYDYMKQTSNYNSDVEDNKHYQYYRKQRSKERDEAARIMKEEEERAKMEAEKNSSDNLNMRRMQRKAQNDSNDKLCVIS